MIDITNGKLQVTALIIITITCVVLITIGGTPNDINLSFRDGLSIPPIKKCDDVGMVHHCWLYDMTIIITYHNYCD